jgi:hypothetical protein
MVAKEKCLLRLARALGKIGHHCHKRRLALLKVGRQQSQKNPVGERPVGGLEDGGRVGAVQGRVAHEVAAALCQRGAAAPEYFLRLPLAGVGAYFVRFEKLNGQKGDVYHALHAGRGAPEASQVGLVGRAVRGLIPK